MGTTSPNPLPRRRGRRLAWRASPTLLKQSVNGRRRHITLIPNGGEGISVQSRKFGGDGGQTLTQAFGLDHRGVGAPAQNGAFDFFEAAQSESEAGTAIGQ